MGKAKETTQERRERGRVKEMLNPLMRERIIRENQGSQETPNLIAASMGDSLQVLDSNYAVIPCYWGKKERVLQGFTIFKGVTREDFIRIEEIREKGNKRARKLTPEQERLNDLLAQFEQDLHGLITDLMVRAGTRSSWNPNARPGFLKMIAGTIMKVRKSKKQELPHSGPYGHRGTTRYVVGK